MFKIHKLGERAALTACAFLAMIRTKGTDGVVDTNMKWITKKNKRETEMKQGCNEGKKS
jgi:hypothetical protein